MVIVPLETPKSVHPFTKQVNKCLWGPSSMEAPCSVPMGMPVRKGFGAKLAWDRQAGPSSAGGKQKEPLHALGGVPATRAQDS